MRKFLITLLALTVATPSFAGTIYIGDGNNDNGYGYNDSGYNSDFSNGNENNDPRIRDLRRQGAALAAQEEAIEAQRACEYNQHRADRLAVDPDMIGGNCTGGSWGSSPTFFGGNGFGNGNSVEGLAGGVLGGLIGGALSNAMNQPRHRPDTRREIADEVSVDELKGCYKTDQGWYRCQNSDQIFKKRNGRFVPIR